MSEDTPRAIGRRAYLKKVAAVGVGLGTAGAAIPQRAAAYEETDYVWRKEDSDLVEKESAGSGADYKVELSSAIVYQGSFQNNSGEWLHQFDEGAHGGVVRKDAWEDESEFEPYDDIIKHEITVENQQPSTSSLMTPDNSRDVGAKPAPDSGTGANYGDAAFTAVKGAVGALHPAIGAGLLAADVVNALQNDGTSDDGYSQTYEWNYGPSGGPSDADHYLGFYVESDDTTAHFTVDEFMSTDMSYTSCTVDWNIYVDVYENLSLQAGPTADTSTSTVGGAAGTSSLRIPERTLPTDSPLSSFADGDDLTMHALPVRIERGR